MLLAQFPADLGHRTPVDISGPLLGLWLLSSCFFPFLQVFVCVACISVVVVCIYVDVCGIYVWYVWSMCGIWV